MEKKIATSVDILINVAKYEHITVTKYSEKKISYESAEEMIQKEDELTAELLNDVKRSLEKCKEGFGKKVAAIADFEENMQKKIPEWLEDGPEPNIANKAQQAQIENATKAHATELEDKEMTDSTNTEMEELFGPDAVEAKEEKKEDVLVEEEKKEDVLEDDDDLFA